MDADSKRRILIECIYLAKSSTVKEIFAQSEGI